MFLLIFAVNQNVIQIGIAAGEAKKYLVDEPLEGLASSLQTKGYASELSKSEWHDYSSLEDVMKIGD